MKYDFMTEAEVSEVNRLLKEEFGTKKWVLQYYFVKKGERVWVYSGDYYEWLRGLNTSFYGLYFGRFEKDGGFRPSQESASIIGPLATKNVVIISEEEAKDWLAGRGLRGDGEGYVLLRTKHYWVGVGQAKKQGKIRNIVPKRGRARQFF